MGIISWIVMGLIVGLLAKFIMPGKDPGGNYYYNSAGYWRRISGWLSWNFTWTGISNRV